MGKQHMCDTRRYIPLGIKHYYSIIYPRYIFVHSTFISINYTWAGAVATLNTFTTNSIYTLRLQFHFGISSFFFCSSNKQQIQSSTRSPSQHFFFLIFFITFRVSWDAETRARSIGKFYGVLVLGIRGKIGPRALSFRAWNLLHLRW